MTLLVGHDVKPSFIIREKGVERWHVLQGGQVEVRLTSSELFRLLLKFFRVGSWFIFLPYLPKQIPIEIINPKLIAPLLVADINLIAGHAPIKREDGAWGGFAGDISRHIDRIELFDLLKIGIE